jgi:hypothetical protein
MFLTVRVWFGAEHMDACAVAFARAIADRACCSRELCLRGGELRA